MPITIIPDTGINNIYVNADTGNSLIISGSVGPLFPNHNSLLNTQGGELDQKYHISLDQYTNLATGTVVRPSETGNFYTRDNPSGYLSTGDLTMYITGGVVYTTGNQTISGQKTFNDQIFGRNNQYYEAINYQSVTIQDSVPTGYLLEGYNIHCSVSNYMTNQNSTGVLILPTGGLNSLMRAGGRLTIQKGTIAKPVMVKQRAYDYSTNSYFTNTFVDKILIKQGDPTDTYDFITNTNSRTWELENLSRRFYTGSYDPIDVSKINGVAVTGNQTISGEKTFNDRLFGKDNTIYDSSIAGYTILNDSNPTGYVTTGYNIHTSLVNYISSQTNVTGVIILPTGANNSNSLMREGGRLNLKIGTMLGPVMVKKRVWTGGGYVPNTFTDVLLIDPSLSLPNEYVFIARENGRWELENLSRRFYTGSYDPIDVSRINGVAVTGDQIITGKKTLTDHLILQVDRNHLQFKNIDTGSTIFITTPAIFGNRTYTIPDVGHSCAFLMNAGPQTISGDKDFTVVPTISGAQILSNRNIQITGEFQSTVGVYAPNLTNIVYSVNNQTINGIKTFSDNIIGNGTNNLFVNEAGFSPHSLLTQQQLMLGGHKFRQLVNVNSKRNTIPTPLLTTQAGAFQTLGMKSQVGVMTGQLAASYTLDGIFCADTSTAALPINNEIDVYFHGVAMQFQTDSTWISRINIGTSFERPVLFSSGASGTDKHWGTEFYYSGSNFYGRLYYHFDTTINNYGNPFILPIYKDALPSAWQGFVYSMRLRQVPFGSNRLRLEFYINDSTSNLGGDALSKTTPLATLETIQIPAINYKFAGKHINFETVSSPTVLPTGIARLQSTNMYCQFK